MSEILARKKGPRRVPGVVGVTGHGLVGHALKGGSTWKYEGSVDVLPSIVSDLVAFSGDGQVVGLDLLSGKVRWRLPADGRRLEGMGFDGDNVVLLLVDPDDARPDQIRVISSLGDPRYELSTLERVGTPGAIGGIGLIPWSYQYVSAFDLITGEPLGRILLRDAVSRVEVRENDVFFLGRGALRFGPEVAKNPEAKTAQIPSFSFPGEPTWPEDGTKPRPPKPNSVSITAYPSGGGEVTSFSGDTFLATYFDVAVGRGASDGGLRWVSHFERSVLATGASSSTFATCMEDGSVLELDAKTGSAHQLSSLGTRLRACVVVAPEKDRAPELTRPDLAGQVLEALRGTGPDMVAVHVVLTEELGKLPGDRITEVLLQIARDPLTAQKVVDRAAAALEKREDGAALMVDALLTSAPPVPEKVAPGCAEGGSCVPADPKAGPAASPKARPPGEPTASGDSTAETGAAKEAAPPETAPGQRLRPPPVRSLARALARMNVKAAAPALARHLHAPLVRAEDAVALIRALAVLGEETEAALILEFFLAYRTVGGDPDFADAIAEAGDFAWRRGSEADRAQVDKAARDTLTHPEVKALLVQKLKTKKKKLPRSGERSPSALPVDLKAPEKSTDAAPKQAAEAKP